MVVYLLVLVALQGVPFPAKQKKVENETRVSTQEMLFIFEQGLLATKQRLQRIYFLAGWVAGWLATNLTS